MGLPTRPPSGMLTLLQAVSPKSDVLPWINEDELISPRHWMHVKDFPASGARLLYLTTITITVRSPARSPKTQQYLVRVAIEISSCLLTQLHSPTSASADSLGTLQSVLTSSMRSRPPCKPGFGIVGCDFTLGHNGYLPQELFDMIIPFLMSDSATLCTFSNVCRAWYLAAQPYRLCDVRLTTRNARSFKRFIRTSPSIRGRVRRLRIDYWRPHPSGFAQDAVPPDLRFITVMKNVTTLRLDTLVVTSSLTRQLSRFLAQITDLTLGELHVVSLDHIARFMRACTSVRKLTLARTPLLHRRSVIRDALHESPRWWYPESGCVGGGLLKDTRKWLYTRKVAATVMNRLYRVLGGRRKPATAWSPKCGSVFFEPLLRSLPQSIEHLVVHEAARLGGTPEHIGGGLLPEMWFLGWSLS